MLFSIGSITFNLADVKTARKVNADVVIKEDDRHVVTQFVFFTVKLDNGDEIFCSKDSPTYEEFVECWSEIIPKFRPKHNVSHKMPSTQEVMEKMKELGFSYSKREKQ